MFRLPFGGHGIPWICPKIWPQGITNINIPTSALLILISLSLHKNIGQGLCYTQLIAASNIDVQRFISIEECGDLGMIGIDIKFEHFYLPSFIIFQLLSQLSLFHIHYHHHPCIINFTITMLLVPVL